MNAGYPDIEGARSGPQPKDYHTCSGLIGSQRCRGSTDACTVDKGWERVVRVGEM